MGKQWYWGGKSSKRGSQYHMDRDNSTTSSSSSTGCMCAVFHMFDFHQFQFTSNLHHTHELASRNSKPTDGSSTTEEANIPKGVEAPRNSLKSEEGSSSLSSVIEEEDKIQESLNLNINIPMGIQIKTSGISGSRLSSGKSPISNDFSSDASSNSPAGPRTPSLVARLMGLDPLPDQTDSPTHFTSPTIHASTQNLHLSRSHTQPLRNKARHLMDGDVATGTRSLPETPRISSARRSDVDIHHHRLSLQINKENVSDHDLNLDFSKLSALRRKQLRVEENQHESYSSRSPGHYARQIVKQVKKSGSRKVGLDITNTMTTRNRSEYNNHHELVINRLKSKRVSKALSKLEEQASRSISGEQNSSSPSSLVSTTTANSSSSSCSPRLMNIRFTDSKTSTSNTSTAPFSTSPKDHQIHQVSTGKFKSNPKISTNNVQPLQDQKQQQKQQQNNVQTMNNISRNSSNQIVKGGNYSTNNGRLQKMQEETFVHRRPSTAADCRTNIPDKIKKCKKTPLSNNLINLNVVPTLLPLKKSPNNSPPSTKKQQYDVFSTSHKHVHKIIPFEPTAEVPDEDQESKRSSQLSSSQGQNHHRHHPEQSSHVLHTRDKIIRNDVVQVPKGNTTTRGGSDSSELRQYITRILARTGISNTSHVSFTNWFSPSHPLDPSIFRRLEMSTYININLSDGEFRLWCNRRLLFDIVDEILVDILRPYINVKPWINNTISSVNYVNDMKGSELIRTLCWRIQRFPCKDCQVLEDIDALIDEDLPGKNDQFQKEMAFEEEGEGLVTEIERDLLDTLVHETALILVLGRD